MLSLGVSLVCVCACFFVLDVLEPYSWQIQTLWVGGLATLALCVHLILRRAWADPFHPDILLSFSHLVQFVVFSTVFATGWFDDLLFTHTQDVRTHFPQMITAVLLGQTAFNMVFCLCPGRQTKRINLTEKGLSGFVVLLAAFVWMARIGIVATGSYWHFATSDLDFRSVSTAYSPMAVMDGLGRIVAAYAALRIFSGSKSGAAVAYLILDLLWSSFSGAREPLFMLFMVIILAYVSVRRRTPWMALVGFGVLLVVLGAFIGTYRGVLRQQASLRRASVGKAVEQAMSVQETTTTKVLLNVVFDRLNDGQYAAGCMKYGGRRVPYLDGSTYAYIFFAPLPRVLYPDRPVFNVDYNTLFVPWVSGSSSAPVSTVGEAYLNFGWPGIPLVFLYLGVLYWGLDRVLGAPRSLSQAAVMVFCASLLVRMAVNPAVTYVSWMIKILLLWIACGWIDSVTKGVLSPREDTSRSIGAGAVHA